MKLTNARDCRRRVPGDHEPVARPGAPRRAHRRRVARVGPARADGAVRRHGAVHAGRRRRADHRALCRGRARRPAQRHHASGGDRRRRVGRDQSALRPERGARVRPRRRRARRSLRSSAVVPLVDNGTVVAVLALYSKNLLAFTDDDLSLLELLGPRLALALSARSTGPADDALPVVAASGAPLRGRARNGATPAGLDRRVRRCSYRRGVPGEKERWPGSRRGGRRQSRACRPRSPAACRSPTSGPCCGS